MAYESSPNDNENQSLRKINALASDLTADVADGVTVSSITKNIGASTAAGLPTAFTSTAGDIILDAEPTRLGYIITNCEGTSGPTLYIRHHPTTNPTATNYDTKLEAGQSFQVMGALAYTGVVRARFASTPSNGARATRFSA